MKKRIEWGPLLIGLLIAVLLFAGGMIQGCAPGQSATQQMIKQTDDVSDIANAVYFDVMGIYKITAKTYLRYKPFLEKSNPSANDKAKDLLNEMKAILDDWKALSGMAQIVAIDMGSDEFHEKRRKIIIELAEYIDKGGM